MNCDWAPLEKLESFSENLSGFGKERKSRVKKKRGLWLCFSESVILALTELRTTKYRTN